MDRHKPLTLSTKTIEELTTALAQCTNSMDQDVKEKDTKNVEHVASFIKLFLLFPLEYYEKNERQQVMLLAFLADAWVLSTTTASAEARITASLLCRGLHLRATSLNSSSSVLNIHPDFLYWFVQSVNEWTVSISTGTRKVLSCLQNITTEIDQDILSTAWSLAGNKSNDMRASTYVEGILKQCITSLDSSTGFYNASTCSWAISILEVTNKYLRSHNKKNTTMDPEEVVYSSQVVSRIGTYVITALKKIQIEISALLERLEAANSDDEQNQMVLSFIPEFTKTKHVLTMTYLLQDYAHALVHYDSIYTVVDITQVSKSLVVASSPFIQFMQMSLRPSTLLDSELKRDVLNITTSFITAFCTTLSRYQQLHTTKRVVAVIWFVYTMVSNSGDLTSIDTLSKTFSTWIQTLSKDDFEILIQSFIEQSEEEVLYRKEQNRFDKHRVFLDLLRLFIQNSTDAQKHVLRKWLPTFILKQSLIVGKTTSIELLDQTLSLVVCITGAKEFSFTSYDLSIVLSCLLQVASPDALERFKGQAHRETVQSLFIRCCDVLSNLLRSHRDALVDVMPSFSAIVQALMHCFKSTHLSLIGSKATENKKRKAGDKQQKDTAPLQSVSGRSMTLFSECAPLDDKCCEKYARLLDLISQKNPATQSKSNAASAQTLWRVMAKYAPYLLMEYFTIQSNSTMSIARAQIKAILTPYFYQLLDMCNDADRSLIMAALDGSGKALFKAFFASWKDNHKYIGQ
ncbi:Urb2/Npa2 family-domain-containing protein [Spinellus fusiger]|nr:Urb2/Npa2 family-domain-containing protein [Spinellus fusiger]